MHIHYSFEREEDRTRAGRWLVLDFEMPIFFRPLRGLVIRSFDKENIRTMAAVKNYAEAHPEGATRVSITRFGRSTAVSRRFARTIDPSNLPDAMDTNPHR